MDKKRVIYFDVLNIFATLGVIFLHCNGLAHTYSNTLAWKQALAVEVFYYWPVPVFFMLSGATLMNYRKRYSTKEFFKKRFFRTVIPFLVWSLISAAVKSINPLDIGEKAFISRIFGTSIENVYWFFIPLFSVYLAMPVISLLKDNRKILWYMVICSFLLNSLLPPIFGYIGIQWNWSLQMITMGGYLFFAVLGYLLATCEFSKKQRIIIYLVGLFGALLRYFATIILSMRDGQINKTFFSYTAYYSVFLAVAVFVLFKNLPIIEKLGANEKAAKIIKNVSGYSFGIYLIHMIIRNMLGSYLPTNCWEWRIFAPFAIYLIALFAVFLMKKIPVIKHIVP